MNTTFTEIDGQEVKKKFPSFYDDQTKFFSTYYKVIKEDSFKGYAIVTHYDPKYCNLAFCSPEEDRKDFKKESLLAVLNFPQQLGFLFCIMLTNNNKLVKIFNMMNKYNVIPFGKSNGYNAFIKDYYLNRNKKYG